MVPVWSSREDNGPGTWRECDCSLWAPREQISGAPRSQAGIPWPGALPRPAWPCPPGCHQDGIHRRGTQFPPGEGTATLGGAHSSLKDKKDNSLWEMRRILILLRGRVCICVCVWVCLSMWNPERNLISKRYPQGWELGELLRRREEGSRCQEIHWGAVCCCFPDHQESRLMDLGLELAGPGGSPHCDPRPWSLDQPSVDSLEWVSAHRDWASLFSAAQAFQEQEENGRGKMGWGRGKGPELHPRPQAQACSIQSSLSEGPGLHPPVPARPTPGTAPVLSAERCFL